MSYLLITASESNRVSKFLEFDAQQEAENYLDTISGAYPAAFVYNNTNNYPVQDLWVEGQVVTYVPIDRLPKAKENKIEQLKLEALDRVNAVFGEIVFNNVGQLRLLQAQFNSFQTDGSVDPLLVSVNNVRQAYQDAKDVINALTTVAEVEAYDVTTTPAWPYG